jgi:hypothetical protein
MISEKYKLNDDDLTIKHSPLQDEQKYMLAVFCAHGAYNKSALPYRVHPHASKSLQTFKSTPKLMTFTNSSPGNVVLANADGSDNTKLTDYFKKHDNINLMANTNQNTKNQDQIIAENFLNYSKSALATLTTNPRDDLEIYRKNKKIKPEYACRNSYICNNQVGIGHTFLNKIFSTNDPPTDLENMDSWGIFIFNNNCGIDPGTRIEDLLTEMPREDITDDDGEDIGVQFRLDHIIKHLTNKYELTNKDYLFLFDFTCSIFCQDINPTKNKRLERSFGREAFDVLGFKETSKKQETGKKRKRGGGKKKTQKIRKNNGRD